MSKRQLRTCVLAAVLLVGSITLSKHQLSALRHKQAIIAHEPSMSQSGIQLASLTHTTNRTVVGAPSLVQAAQIATPAVVHIKATYEPKTAQAAPRANTPLEQLFREFFGEGFNASPDQRPSQSAHGSGVIIEANGYIVTNNHVIDGADQVEVTLDDNRKYSAQIVGRDPSTDLALLKIKEKGLPYLKFGNSDTLQIGEWVLAVGNPFNLNSTVTKGIVSAKARQIDTLQNRNQMRIEAFIQTDAAVNKGNSGGALVNLQGELVGINTAIASNTGGFAGYSFAIPASIVQKITDDLKKYGIVQRALLGISIRDMDADLAKAEGVKQLNGVYIADMVRDGAAAVAGLRIGDVIVAVNGNKIKNISQLHEQIARYKPNDKIQLTYYRKDRAKTVTVMLKSMENLRKFEIVSTQNGIEVGGATFENVDAATCRSLHIKAGVRIKSLKEGTWKQAGLSQGFVITAIDGELVECLDQLVSILNLSRKKEAILISGYMRNGTKVHRAVDLE